MKLRSLQIKLGIFVVVGIALLMLTIVALGEFSKYFEDYYVVRAYFSNVSGIEAGTPVRLAGVNIGQVENIRLAQVVPPVEVTLRIKKVAYIREDATLWIGFEGTLAQRYLEFDQGTPGTSFLPKDGTGVVTNTDVQITFSTFLERLDKTRAIKDKEVGDLLVRAADLADRLNTLAEHIDDLAGDDAFQKNIKLTMAGASQTTEKAAALVDKWTEVGDETKALVSDARTTIHHTNVATEIIQDLS
jgi:phospholipid/cholesterol/gamma-HCH transport system substrate-binding protein